MTTISVTEFSAHLQNYLSRAVQGEKIVIQLENNHMLTLIEAQTKNKTVKKYPKLGMLKNISYYGSSTDSQDIDDLLYL